jgi:hypothetical protein
MASNLINALNDFIPASLKPTPKAKPKAKQVPVPVATTYESADVAIPPSFLVDEPTDARGPVTSRVINWEETPLPEHASRDGGRYAVILDNVLSPSECDTLLRLTESSVPLQDGDGEPWKPALVNVGYGREVLMSEYRNSDRIIWDTQEVMDRLWARCARAPGVLDALATVEDTSFDGPKTWEFARFNQRGRFLKYTGGQFFRRKSFITKRSRLLTGSTLRRGISRGEGRQALQDILHCAPVPQRLCC